MSLGCLVVGSSLIWKKEKLTEMVTRCHLFPFVATRCHSLYHSLSFIITRCNSLYHSLLLVVPLAVTRCHSIYHSSVFLKAIIMLGGLYKFYKVFRDDIQLKTQNKQNTDKRRKISKKMQTCVIPYWPNQRPHANSTLNKIS